MYNTYTTIIAIKRKNIHLNNDNQLHYCVSKSNLGSTEIFSFDSLARLVVMPIKTTIQIVPIRRVPI